ncbi:hypothetical protein WJX72_010719 [[Myrmecia] bisecta]|uniref:MARVEL domain-containing protein n=1 Tax=[Myrmecia] bisecta TaxID=41462 RepID=A0AAW1Q8N0_9CHLO
MTPRFFIWTFWSLHEVASALFAITAIISFRNLQVIYSSLPFGEKYVLNGVMASAFLGFLLVILYGVLSGMLLFKNSVAHSRMHGFWFGVLVSMSFQMSLFLLLVGCVMNSFDKSVKAWQDANVWQSGKVANYYTAFVLAYILAGTHMLSFFLLLIFRQAFTDQPVTNPARGKSPKASGVPVTATASSA